MSEIFSVLFSSDRSSSGKSTLTIAFAYKLKEMGISTMLYKIGPDFIDPIVISNAVKSPVKNIDLNLIPSKRLYKWFFADVQGVQEADNPRKAFIIEGAMGLYDGISYLTAKRFKTPVVLVMDCKKISGTLASLVFGLKNYKKGMIVSGVILNNISSLRHYEIISEEIKSNIKNIEVFGYVLNNEKNIGIKERHLGLTVPSSAIANQFTSEVIPEGLEEFDGKIINLQKKVMENIDVDLMIKTLKKDSKSFLKLFRENYRKRVPSVKNICENNINIINNISNNGDSDNDDNNDNNDNECIKDIFNVNCRNLLNNSRTVAKREFKRFKSVKIAVPYDDAFLFYYNFNFEILKRFGAEMAFFSPINDRTLPSGTKAIYIGGGYPELYAKELSSNISLKKDIYDFFLNNGIIYGECGGLMYLCRNLIYKGNIYEFLGILPFTVTMDDVKLTLGYRTIHTAEDSIFGMKGLRINGHEFHYSKLILDLNDVSGYNAFTDNSCKDDGKNGKNSCNNYNDINRLNVKTVFSFENPAAKGVFYNEGYNILNALGTYIHVSFFSNMLMARNFVENAKRGVKR